MTMKTPTASLRHPSAQAIRLRTRVTSSPRSPNSRSPVRQTILMIWKPWTMRLQAQTMQEPILLPKRPETHAIQDPFHQFHQPFPRHPSQHLSKAESRASLLRIPSLRTRFRNPRLASRQPSHQSFPRPPAQVGCRMARPRPLAAKHLGHSISMT